MPTHAEQRHLPHTPQQLFDLVADIKRYPEFLPWCRGARVRTETETEVVADLIIGFKGITERFTSRVKLDRQALAIHVAYEDGPFKYLNNHWKFLPGEDEGHCTIDFYVDFEFRSRLLQKMIEFLFEEAVRRMVAAFETRANQLYG